MNEIRAVLSTSSAKSWGIGNRVSMNCNVASPSTAKIAPVVSLREKGGITIINRYKYVTWLCICYHEVNVCFY